MRKLFTLGVLLLICVIALGPSQGQAFNSATHIYIAERVFPFAFDKINLYYGSIAPDIALYVYPPENWPYAFCETHYKFTKLPYAWWNLTQRAFAKGWQTHNEIWGADSYAHGTCGNYDNCFSFENCVSDNCSQCCNYDDGYVPALAEDLAELFPILNGTPGSELAHFAIEVAIDLLLVRYHEPGLGLKLLGAAKYRSQQDLNLMLQTLVPDDGPSAETLQEAESTFREIVIAYASALALPDPLRMIAISELGVQIAAQMDVTITPYEAWEILKKAMILCEEPDLYGHTYLEIIRSAIEGIRKNPDLIR